MRRGTRPATVAVAAMALVLAVGQSPAMAAAAAGSSYSAAGHQDSTPSGLTPVITPTGLAAVLAPVLTGVVNPLVAALTSLPNQLTSGVTSGLTGAGLEARNPANQQSAPSSGFPSCNTGGWTTSDCYGPVLPTVGVPPLLSIGTGAFQGFATGDATGYTARAQSSNPALSLLGLPIGNLGLITSSSVCPAAGSCSSTDSLTGMSLLGGAVTASVAAPGGLLQVSVNSAAAVSVSSLPTTNLGVLAVVGAPVTLSSAGTLLRLQIGLTLPQLLNGLGLSGLLAGVLGLTYSGHGGNLDLDDRAGQDHCGDDIHRGLGSGGRR